MLTIAAFIWAKIQYNSFKILNYDTILQYYYLDKM